MNEQKIKNEIMLLLSSKYNAKVFTNPCGVAWMGGFVRRLPSGETVLAPGARRVTFGLLPGSPDIVGWHSVEITPSMVGLKLAVFVGIETKADTGTLREAQRKFLKQLEKDGALCGVAKNNNDAVSIITRLSNERKSQSSSKDASTDAQSANGGSRK